jgi:2-polyprenyl-3-methyl-5-hydroxy-6-metoxy-1,4-benzoquinol methylase
MTPERETQPTPTPALFFDTANAYQRTEALKAGVELNLFTTIGEGKKTAAEIAQACGASERGVRILCDYLAIVGFLTKQDAEYALTRDSAMFLDKRSPGYMGGTLEFLLTPKLVDNFKRLTEAVRKGGTVMSDEGMVEADNPAWVKFARAMAPMMAMPAQLMAQLVDPKADQKLKILDIAAGHGLYGLAFAQRNPNAEVTALDWANVLEVARENAEQAGVAERFQTIAGSAMDVDFGTGFDLVLLTNFLHHFDTATCEQVLRKVHSSLADGGRAITLEFIPNADRVSPPQAAAFSLMMLGSTPAGDAYTFSEFEKMFSNAGFSGSELHDLPPTIQRVVISRK